MIRPATAVGLLWLTAVASAAALPPAGRDDVGSAGYADGAPPGFSGAFGEQSCHACHFDGEVNAPPGQVAIEGVPDRFTPGAAYPLTISLQRADLRTGGFQLTARFVDGGAQAGTLAVRPDDGNRLKVESRDDVLYVNQRSAGAPVDSPGMASWTVLWTAPIAGGPVRLDVAANAGNRDENAGGDHVFTASRRSAPAR